MTEPLKIEINKGVSYRDVCSTLDEVLTTIGEKIGESFNNQAKYPAIISTGEVDPSKGVITAEAIKLSTPVKLQLIDEVSGSVVFDGSEKESPGIILPCTVEKIIDKKVKDYFTIYQNKLFINNSYNLGYVDTNNDNINQGYLLGKRLSETFEKTDNTNVVVIKYATNANQFKEDKTINIKGDLIGTVTSNFSSNEININNTVAQIREIDNIELTNWKFKYTNETAEHPISELNEQRINAVEYYSTTITNKYILKKSNIMVLPPAIITKRELLKLQRLNLQEGTQDLKTLTLRSYGPEKPTGTIKIRLMIYGVNY